MRNMICIVITVTLCLSVSGCGSDEKLPGGSGFLEATEIIVSCETSGRVMTLLFDEGTVLNRQDTLLLIDTTRLHLEMTAVKAGWDAVKTKLRTVQLKRKMAIEAKNFTQVERDRVANMLNSGTATKKQMDLVEHEHTQTVLACEIADADISTIEAELDKITADIRRVERSREDCFTVAPISGTVTEKYINAGELLGPGMPIARITRLDSLWVKVYLPMEVFASVRIGDVATIDTESGGGQYQGKVVWTSQEAEFTPKNVQTSKSRANLVYAVKVMIANTDYNLKVGMPVYVTIDKS